MSEILNQRLQIINYFICNRAARFSLLCVHEAYRGPVLFR